MLSMSLRKIGMVLIQATSVILVTGDTVMRVYNSTGNCGGAHSGGSHGGGSHGGGSVGGK
jgi:hypothetical protein